MRADLKKILRSLLVFSVFFVFVYLTSFATLVYPYRMITQMRMETWAEYAGKLQARVWSQENRFRLLELVSTTNLHFSAKFTGKKEGSFEIWTHPVFSSTNPNWLTWLTKDDSDQIFIESFNERMKQLWNERQKTAMADSESKTNKN